MRRLAILVLAASAMLSGCVSNGSGKAAELTSDNVKVMIFHAAQRCATCRAIDAVVSDVVGNDYAVAVSDSTLVLMDIDLSDASNRELVEHYQVLSTSLIIDNHGEVQNLTKEAFAYARSNADELKRILKSHLDKALE